MAEKLIFTDINQLMTLKGAVKKEARKVDDKDLGLVKNGAIVVEKGVIQWTGSQSKIPEKFEGYKKVSLKGGNVFPGFVDCHTHLIFAGDRKNEFELRNQGVSYQEIAKKGGGILSTMKATRRTSLNDLVELGQQRVDQHIAQGVTTIEVKSGYGLNTKSEIKMLEAANQLKKAQIVPTFLGAHAIPEEFRNEKEYLIKLSKDLDEIRRRKLSNRVDIFIEKGYFSYKEAKKYLLKAHEKGFYFCIHADQLSHSKATQLAVELNALSADHAICLSKKDKARLAQSETTAVLLPCADF
ncbi:MAG: amidohydrolase family protein, partial [Bdellovibrionales bacterium]|nr:amidohydrolase family protein [Bdellovibrionales bacterium]